MEVAPPLAYVIFDNVYLILSIKRNNPNQLRVKIHVKGFGLFFSGGDKRIRTAGLLVANEALYQLSHIPKAYLLYLFLSFLSTIFCLALLFF